MDNTIGSEIIFKKFKPIEEVSTLSNCQQVGHRCDYRMRRLSRERLLVQEHEHISRVSSRLADHTSNEQTSPRDNASAAIILAGICSYSVW